MVYRRSAIEGIAQIKDFGYVVSKHFDTVTSKLEPGQPIPGVGGIVEALC